jgi:sn-glycerol 3-phosphate transport system substrate-binding protein
MRRQQQITIVVATVAGLLLAACGGDDGGTTEPGGTEPATATEAPGETAVPATEEGGGGAVELPPCPVDALEGASGPVEVVVWHTQTAEPGDTLVALTEQYNASQDRVRVRLESQGASYTELKRKFQAALPSGDLPALILFDDTSTQEMADSGVVLPGQACFETAGESLDAFTSVATSYYTVDDVMWPVAANLGGVLLYYNRDHFKLAGLDPDAPPTTLDEMRAAAEAIKAAGVAETPVVHELSSWKTEFWLTGAGSPIVDNDNGRGLGSTSAGALADNPQALELFTWFDDMVDDGLLLPVPASDGQIDQYLALAGRNGSMLIETSSAATSIERFLGGGEVNIDGFESDAPSPSGLDIAAAAFPGLVPGHATQMGGAAWYLMNTTPDEVQAAAWHFITFINSAEAQIELLVGGSYIPWRTQVLDEPEVTEFFSASLSGRWLEIAARQIDDIDPTFPGPLIGPYDPDAREAIEKAQDSLLFGQATPQEALDQAQQGIDRAIELYNSFN